MTLYIPKHFAGDDATARKLIAEHPFAALVTAAAEDVQVTHLPLLLDDSGDALIGHVAKPNPHWRAFEQGETTAIFHGPHAFVSRGWYENPADNVPTWNYATVHATGRPVLADAAETRAAVERLVARFEPPTLAPIAEAKLERLLHGIVAFRMPIARLEVKFKMSQNKPPADRAGVIRGLRKAGEDATVAWMETHEPR